MADMHRNQPVPSPLPSQGIDGASRGPQDGIIFPVSLLRAAATYTSNEMFNANAKGVRLFVISPASAGSGNVTVKIQVKDPNTGVWVDLALAVTAAISGNSQNVILTVYPALTNNPNVVASQFVGSAWRVVATVASNTYSFTVGADYLL